MHIRSLALLLAVCLMLTILPACNAPQATTAATEQPDTTQPVTTVPPTTEAPTTEAPTTEAPTTAPETTAPETTAPVTTIPETTVPPTTEAPTTVPPTTVPVNYSEMIGSLYTRGQLMAMENTNKGYGCGTITPGQRPSLPVNCQEAYGQYAGNFIGPDDNRVYLTFDCGYEHTVDGKRVTEMILDVLKEKDVQAVFFVTDYYCRQSPDLIRRMIDEGHSVGNHTSNHPSMPNQSIDTMVRETMSLHQLVQDTFGYTMNLFRTPKGEFSTRSLAVTQSLGYKSVHWSFAYADWNTSSQPSYDAALNNVVSSAHNGCIYLLHAVSLTNAQILGEAIDQIRDNGYVFALFS